MIRNIFGALVLLFAFVNTASAQNCVTYPNNLVNGTNADATAVMGNFNYVLPCVRDKLTAARTYFVRTDGNDSNNGLSNTSGGAFLTINKALTVASTLDFAAWQLTITVTAGTYNEKLLLPATVGGLAPILQGVGSTTIVNYFGAINESVIENPGNTPWIVKDLKITGANNTSYGLSATDGANVKFSGIDFGSGVAYQINVARGGSIQAIGNYSISGGGGAHYIAFGGIIAVRTFAVTITGTPAFGAFAQAIGPSMIDVLGMTFSGSATGSRYSLSSGASTFGTGGSSGSGTGPTFFPGNAAGTNNGGFYN